MATKVYSEWCNNHGINGFCACMQLHELTDSLCTECQHCRRRERSENRRWPYRPHSVVAGCTHLLVAQRAPV